MAAGEGAIWLLDTDGTVVRVDPATDQVVARIPVVRSATYLAVGRKAVWVTCCGPHTASGPGTLYRIDPATNRVISRTALGGSPGSVATGAGGVWVINYQGELWHIDPTSNHVLATIRLSYPSLTDVVADRRWVFVTVRSGLDGSGGIVKIDPQTTEVASRVAVPGALMGVTAAAGKVWVNSGPLVVVQPSVDNVTVTVPVFPPTDSNAGIAVLGSSIWLAGPVDNQLVQIDRR